MKLKELLTESELKLFNLAGEIDALLYLFKIIDKPTDEKRATAIDNLFISMVACMAKNQFMEVLKAINLQYCKNIDELDTQILFTLPQKILDATQEKYVLKIGNEVKKTFDKLTNFATENNLPWTFDDNYILNLSTQAISLSSPLELSKYEDIVTQFVISAHPENLLSKYFNDNIIEEFNKHAKRHQIILNCHSLSKQVISFNSPFISDANKSTIILKAYQIASTNQENAKWYNKLIHANMIHREKIIIDEMARTIVTMNK